MNEPRDVFLEGDAVAALGQIVGIMSDHMYAADGPGEWNAEQLADLDAKLCQATGGGVVTLGIEDVALLLQGMAFTEIMSMELPWFDMVQWTSDFITGELRRHWTEDEWRKFASA